MLNCVEDTNLSDSYMHKKIMKLEGIGKYPYVIAKICSESTKMAENSSLAKHSVKNLDNRMTPESVEELTINFGCVAIGRSSEKWITVENPSPVSYLSIKTIILLKTL